LIGNDELNRISEIDFNAMNEIIQFLKPFKNCSEKLSSDTEPTYRLQCYGTKN